MTAPVQTGEILARKYRVERVLGEGGMGVVLGARHLHLDEMVAIKLLRADVGKDERVVERFMREARMASKIKSEHVVRVSDVDTLESGEPYIVMEYLRGRDLQSLASEEGALSVQEAVDYVLQACDAIAEAHGRGIVHRDLKPANLFLAQRPNGSLCVKVLDFGISKLSEQARAAQMDVTSTAAVLGSPNYMSPEQMRSSREVDARTDIWSLGITLYQLLTGVLPFHGETVAAVHGLVQYTEPKRPLELRPELPREIEDIILRCLEKDPSRRFQTVIDLAHALVPFGPEGAEAPEDRFPAQLPSERPLPLITLAQPKSADLAPTVQVEGPHPTMGAAPTMRYEKNEESSKPEAAPEASQPQAPSATGTSISFEPQEDDDNEPPTYLPRRLQLRWIVAGVLLVTLLVGGFLMLRLRGRKAVDGGTPSATTGSIETQVDMLSPTVPSAAASAPPTPISAAPPMSSVPVASSAKAASSADAPTTAGAARSRPPTKEANKAPPPPPSTSLKAPLPTPSPVLTGPTGLDTEKCFAKMPDGTRKQVPCQ